MSDFADLRGQMVRRQIEARGIFDPMILDAFREVPREEFVDEEHRRWAYDDNPLPIEAGQTISQPYIVALMIEAAEIAPGRQGARGRRRLRIRGRGDEPHRRACLAIERQHELVEVARERLGGSATTTSRSSRATARAAARTRRRSTRSSPRRAAAMSRSRSSTSSRPAGGW